MEELSMQATVFAPRTLQRYREGGYSPVFEPHRHRPAFVSALPITGRSESERAHLDEIGRLNRLKRYVNPQIVDTVLNGESALFRSHRREITVVFMDLRGFTAFSDMTEPEQAMELLKEYHAAMGSLVMKFNGTPEQFAGDGLMVFFNDPVPQEDHTERAVRMAIEMRECGKGLRAAWLRNGWDLDLGIGLAAGSAALGNIALGGRVAYTAVGNVTNLAARLCTAARGGQILTDQRTAYRVARQVEVEAVGSLHLKGFRSPVEGFNVTRWVTA
jgi:adenylate cyclase